MNGHVYLINAVGTSRYKIGFASDVNRRLLELQTNSPFNLEVVVSMSGDIALERKLHKKYAENRRVGEWFEFPDISHILHEFGVGHWNVAKNEAYRKGEASRDCLDGFPSLSTNRELSLFLHISETTLWRLRRSQNLSFHRLGGKIRYTHADVRDFLERNRLNTLV